MPGLTIYASFEPISAPLRQNLRNSSDLMRHYPRYTRETIIEHQMLDISFVAFEHYPRMSIAYSQYTVFIEGAIYNKSRARLEAELRELAPELTSNHRDCRARVAEWIMENDGEYIVIVHNHETGALALLNDVLGRLPMFYRRLPNKALLLSRETKYLIAAAGENSLDPIGIGEFLKHGFSLGDRTMSCDVKRLPPASLVRFYPETRTSEIQVLHSWDVGSAIDDSLSLEAHAERAAVLLCEATRNRVKFLSDYRLAMALSGGLDSRAVVSALVHETAEFLAYTCLDHDGSNKKDVDMAQRVASLMSLNWTKLALNDPPLEDVIRIVTHQEGGSVAWTASAFQHFQFLEVSCGFGAALFTGDGGGNVMYPFCAPAPVRSVDDILRLSFDAIFCWDPETAENLLKLRRGELREVAHAVYDAYPEKSATWKYAHSKFLGRPYRFIMEGEDRTRFGYWLAAPFWGTQLVCQLLTVPESYKSNYRFFRAVLRELHPGNVKIPYAAMLINVPFTLLPMYAWGNQFIKSHPGLYRQMRTLLIRQRAPQFSSPQLDQRLRRIIASSTLVSEYFDKKLLIRIFEGGIPRMNYYLLATVLLRIEMHEDIVNNTHVAS